jgi:pimeloyl-ACP methyl ester carboxylesterase
MSAFVTKNGTQIYYKDWGSGPPVVFSHGCPLSADAWDSQMFFLASKGYHSIAHDRRGHGRSSQPWNGNDMDILLLGEKAAAVQANGAGQANVELLFSKTKKAFGRFNIVASRDSAWMTGRNLYPTGGLR